jgi:hypothetical protein
MLTFLAHGGLQESFSSTKHVRIRRAFRSLHRLHPRLSVSAFFSDPHSLDPHRQFPVKQIVGFNNDCFSPDT